MSSEPSRKQKRGGGVAGEVELEPLDGLVELVAEVFVDEGDEGGDLVGLGGAEVGACGGSRRRFGF